MWGKPYCDSQPLRPSLRLNGADLFRVRTNSDEPGTHALATVTLDYRPSREVSEAFDGGRHSGPGVYACFFDNRLFYVGIYAGQQANPLHGNVARERWLKHVDGMTLRGRSVSLCAREMEKVEQFNHPGPLRAALLAAGEQAIHQQSHSARQVTYAKFRFAERHWQDFSRFDDNCLARFSFFHLRPCLSGPLAGLMHNKDAIKRHLRAIEGEIVRALAPPCNKASPNNSGRTTARTSTAELVMVDIALQYLEELRLGGQRPS